MRHRVGSRPPANDMHCLKIGPLLVTDDSMSFNECPGLMQADFTSEPKHHVRQLRTFSSLPDTST